MSNGIFARGTARGKRRHGRMAFHFLRGVGELNGVTPVFCDGVARAGRDARRNRPEACSTQTKRRASAFPRVERASSWSILASPESVRDRRIVQAQCRIILSRFSDLDGLPGCGLNYVDGGVARADLCLHPGARSRLSMPKQNHAGRNRSNQVDEGVAVGVGCQIEILRLADPGGLACAGAEEEWLADFGFFQAAAGRAGIGIADEVGSPGTELEFAL